MNTIDIELEMPYNRINKVLDRVLQIEASKKENMKIPLKKIDTINNTVLIETEKTNED